MTELSILALENISLLRELNRHERPASMTALANAVDRDLSNVSKSVKKLRDAGMVELFELALAPSGLDQVRAIGRAEHGREDMLPKGWVLLKHNEMCPDPNNPRKEFDEQETADLAASIGARGLLQNLTVRPRVMDAKQCLLVSGERRWRAIAQLIKSGEWPPERAILCQEREIDNLDALADALVENLQRADLNPMDEAEAYLKLELAGKTAAQIEAMVGRRGKRSVQQYIKVAKELPGEDKARVRSGDLTIFKAISQTQEHKAPKPALELSPRQALALVEIARAAQLCPAEEISEPGYTRLWTTPTGGPIDQLYQRKLIGLKPTHKGVFAKVMAASTDAGAFLASLGFDANPDICVHQARVKALGELEASTIARGAGQPIGWATPELREPVREKPAPLTSVHFSGGLDPDLTTTGDDQTDLGARSAEASALSIENAADADAQGEAEAYGSDRWTTVKPATDPAKPDLTAADRLILIELAHATLVDPVKLPGGANAVRVGPHWLDQRANDLAIRHYLLFSNAGPDRSPIAMVSPTGFRWFTDNGFEVGPENLIKVTSGDCYDARVDALGQEDMSVNNPLYATPWLNLAEPDAHAEAAPDPAPGPTPQPAYQSDLGRAILKASAETRALQSMDAACSACAALMSKALSKKLEAGEVNQAIALIDAARALARPLINDQDEAA